MDQQPLNYNKHCMIPFGAFVQANYETNPTNPNFLRTIDGIYLQSFDKMQGGHDRFDLHSHRVITRRKNIETTIPKEIIKHIEEMSTHEKITSLKSIIEWESYMITTGLQEWNMKTKTKITVNKIRKTKIIQTTKIMKVKIKRNI